VRNDLVGVQITDVGERAEQAAVQHARGHRANAASLRASPAGPGARRAGRASGHCKL
jgi:hypothetical protein